MAVPVVAANAARAAAGAAKAANAAKTVKAGSDAQKLINTANKLNNSKVAQAGIGKARADQGLQSALNSADKLKDGMKNSSLSNAENKNHPSLSNSHNKDNPSLDASSKLDGNLSARGPQSALNAARQLKMSGPSGAGVARNAARKSINTLKNGPLPAKRNVLNNMYQTASAVNSMRESQEETSEEDEYENDDYDYPYNESPVTKKQEEEEEAKKKKRTVLTALIGGITTTGCGCLAFPFLVIISTFFYLLGTIQLADGSTGGVGTGSTVIGGTSDSSSSNVGVGSTITEGISGSLTSVGGQAVVNCARKQIGKPYLWGEEGPDSFDCSGLVTYCYRQVYGVEVPHQTKLQNASTLFVTVSSVNELSPGDIILDGVGSSDGIHHVGIYTEKGTVIHARTHGDYVKEDSLATFKGWVSGTEVYRRYKG